MGKKIEPNSQCNEKNIYVPMPFSFFKSGFPEVYKIQYKHLLFEDLNEYELKL